MKNIAHLVYSEAPLPENVNHLAICGKIVYRAKQACMFDEQAMGRPLDIGLGGVCRDCYFAVPPQEGKFLVYAFKEGKPE